MLGTAMVQSKTTTLFQRHFVQHAELSHHKQDDLHHHESSYHHAQAPSKLGFDQQQPTDSKVFQRYMNLQH